MKASHWLRQLAAAGRWTFSTTEAQHALGGTPIAVQAALRRLRKKGELLVPVRGFHVIVPRELQYRGVVPPDLYLAELLEHLGEHWYVGLASAARVHGAEDVPGLALQVVVAWTRPGFACAGHRAEFIGRANVADVPVLEVDGEWGPLMVSTAEATAMDLVGYPGRVGGIQAASRLVAQLAPTMDPEHLLEVVPLSPLAWVQRLGWMLEQAGAEGCAEALGAFVDLASPAYVSLEPRGRASGSRNRRWRVVLAQQPQ